MGVGQLLATFPTPEGGVCASGGGGDGQATNPGSHHACLHGAHASFHPAPSSHLDLAPGRAVLTGQKPPLQLPLRQGGGPGKTLGGQGTGPGTDQGSLLPQEGALLFNQRGGGCSPPHPCTPAPRPEQLRSGPRPRGLTPSPAIDGDEVRAAFHWRCRLLDGEVTGPMRARDLAPAGHQVPYRLFDILKQRKCKEPHGAGCVSHPPPARRKIATLPTSF